MPRAATKKRPTSRIEALQAIIDTPCTDPKCQAAGVCGHAGEKEAARTQLARILGNVKARQDQAGESGGDAEPGLFGSEEYRAAWAKIMERGYDDHGNQWWVGAKHRQASHAGPVTYAQAIRQDIKMARRAGRFPLVDPADGAAALSVQAVELFRFDPIGQAPAEIKISVRKDGGGVHITVKDIPLAWGWITEEHAGQGGKKYTNYRVTAELEELGRELRRVANAYNASYGSNLMTDCYASAFTASVLAVNPDGWHVSI
ncbi:hypothetical protein [Streptomyces violaceusniger]|uniref:Uncharacterized protein n=1 Tax=Streptomyces violaceusniger (strain Tu 4113) TaxID=653045 RepID=G2PHS2_STRV4|nr:hypothetical protein [Streptomyces violaceusniger]AEM88873.1 hypothetical protein Strvi_0097 [Streptomyces violaceusniger Tu 4113]